MPDTPSLKESICDALGKFAILGDEARALTDLFENISEQLGETIFIQLFPRILLILQDELALDQLSRLAQEKKDPEEVGELELTLSNELLGFESSAAARFQQKLIALQKMLVLYQPVAKSKLDVRDVASPGVNDQGGIELSGQGSAACRATLEIDFDYAALAIELLSMDGLSGFLTKLAGWYQEIDAFSARYVVLWEQHKAACHSEDRFSVGDGRLAKNDITDLFPTYAEGQAFLAKVMRYTRARGVIYDAYSDGDSKGQWLVQGHLLIEGTADNPTYTQQRVVDADDVACFLVRYINRILVGVEGNRRHMLSWLACDTVVSAAHLTELDLSAALLQYEARFLSSSSEGAGAQERVKFAEITDEDKQYLAVRKDERIERFEVSGRPYTGKPYRGVRSSDPVFENRIYYASPGEQEEDTSVAKRELHHYGPDSASVPYPIGQLELCKSKGGAAASAAARVGSNDAASRQGVGRDSADGESKRSIDDAESSSWADAPHILYWLAKSTSVLSFHVATLTVRWAEFKHAFLAHDEDNFNRFELPFQTGNYWHYVFSQVLLAENWWGPEIVNQLVAAINERLNLFNRVLGSWDGVIHLLGKHPFLLTIGVCHRGYCATLEEKFRKRQDDFIRCIQQADKKRPAKGVLSEIYRSPDSPSVEANQQQVRGTRIILSAAVFFWPWKIASKQRRYPIVGAVTKMKAAVQARDYYCEQGDILGLRDLLVLHEVSELLTFTESLSEGQRVLAVSAFLGGCQQPDGITHKALDDADSYAKETAHASLYYADVISRLGSEILLQVLNVPYYVYPENPGMLMLLQSVNNNLPEVSLALCSNLMPSLKAISHDPFAQGNKAFFEPTVYALQAVLADTEGAETLLSRAGPGHPFKFNKDPFSPIRDMASLGTYEFATLDEGAVAFIANLLAGSVNLSGYDIGLTYLVALYVRSVKEQFAYVSGNQRGQIHGRLSALNRPEQYEEIRRKESCCCPRRKTKYFEFQLMGRYIDALLEAAAQKASRGIDPEASSDAADAGLLNTAESALLLRRKAALRLLFKKELRHQEIKATSGCVIGFFRNYPKSSGVASAVVAVALALFVFANTLGSGLPIKERGQITILPGLLVIMAPILLGLACMHSWCRGFQARRVIERTTSRGHRVG